MIEERMISQERRTLSSLKEHCPAYYTATTEREPEIIWGRVNIVENTTGCPIKENTFQICVCARYEVPCHYANLGLHELLSLDMFCVQYLGFKMTWKHPVFDVEQNIHYKRFQVCLVLPTLGERPLKAQIYEHLREPHYLGCAGYQSSRHTLTLSCSAA